VSAFKDHFSARSADYAAYRPTYPMALVEHLASQCAATEVALDVGCGTGQLSVLLTERFDRVIATDASAQQIESAQPHPRVTYRVAPAEASGVATASIDLIVAAQAAHWFDLPALYTEARRVAKPGAVLALVTYGVLQADPDVDAVIQHFYNEIVGAYWPPERRHVENGYREFAFPFDEWAAPSLAITVEWRVADLVGYTDTWSAVRGVEKALGRSPIPAFERDLTAAWGDPDRRRTIRFPLSMRVGRLG
jgi:SAM-dependent methyltransferase